MPTEDFGINDPNLQQLIEQGINNPAYLAKILDSDSGASLVPGLRNRQDAATKNFLSILAQNNLARGLLSERKLGIEEDKNIMTHQGNMMNHAAPLVKEGIDLNDMTPYRGLIRPGANTSIGVSALLGRQGKIAYNQNQRMEAMERGANSGYVTDEGAQLDPNESQLPIVKRDGSRATSVLAALARAQANNGKIQAQYGPDDNLIASTITLPPGQSPPRNLAQPGQDRDLAVPPAVEQELRTIQTAPDKLGNRKTLNEAQFAKLPNGKGYVAKYKSGGKDVTVLIPADANGRPLKDKAQIINAPASAP